MLVVPYQTKFNLRSLPVATLLLIALNVLVFFGWQGRDDARYAAAFDFYAGSDLVRIELPRYQAYLQQQSTPQATQRLNALRTAPQTVRPQLAARLIQSDAQFQRLLKAGTVVRGDELVSQQWQRERASFEALLRTVFTERYQLQPGTDEPWRLLTHQFLHGDLGHLLGNMVVLLLAGAFAEAALGRLRFLLGYLLCGVAGGLAHWVISPASLIGASGAVSGAMAMTAVLYGMRQVPVFYWVWVYFDTAKVPAIALLPVWIGNEVLQWALNSEGSVAYWAHLGGFAAGVPLAWLLRSRDPRKVDRIVEAQFADERQAARRTSLARQAQDAAAKLDLKRAARLYRELVELNPGDTGHLLSYFNVALMGHDTEALADAALRVLWLRSKSAADQLRKVYLQMSQPKVLQVLPVDEQLRLARRLVRGREDAAALRVLDSVLADDNLRTLYGRQTADCLLGLYTTYSRYGLKQPAAEVKARLKRYFPQPGSIGGLAPNTSAPSTIRGPTTARTRGPNSTLRGPDTLHIDLS